MDVEKYQFCLTGVIRYDPVRPNMKGGKFTKKGKITANTKFRKDWWCVINLDDSIGHYYRWFLDRHWYEVDHSPIKRPMVRPGFRTHVSVIRGEKPPDRCIDKWKYRDGERVKVWYSNNIIQSGDTTNDRSDRFFLLDAYCEAFSDIRKTMGLRWERNGIPFNPHICISVVNE